MEQRMSARPATRSPRRPFTVASGDAKPCACGCGRLVSQPLGSGRRRMYFEHACKLRTYRRRSA
jgi:hypothetical protein